jgi:hypothetical protein
VHLLAGYKYLAFHDLKAPNIDLEIATMPMASDENSPPPMAGYKRQGALQLGPRKRPHVYSFSS